MNQLSKAVCTVAACVVAAVTVNRAEDSQKSAPDLAWVQDRVQKLEPTAKERRIDEIGWAGSIREAERLVGLLERKIKKLKVQPGQALLAPAPQSAPPKCAPDSLVLHLTSRSLDGRGAWNDFPVEDWIVLSQGECAKLLPRGNSRAGDSWVVDEEISARLLTR